MAKVKVAKKGVKTKGKKKKNNRLKKLIRIALLILIIILVVSIFKFLFGLFDKGADKITLIIGENKIELKNELLIDGENNIYLSKDDIAYIYDENIYYNPADKTLITTYNKHVAVLVLDKSTMTINDTVVSINGTLKENKGILYLPFSDMIDIYDFEYEYNEGSKTLIVDSTNEEKCEAIVEKNSKVKDGTGLFAKKLEKINKGKSVTVLGVEGKYTKVRTDSGNIGYIKTKKLSEVEKIRDDFIYEKLFNVQVLTEYNEVSADYGTVINENNQT